LNQGRPADAISYAARAIQADESNSEGWIVLGAARWQTGDRKAAKEAYRSCAERARGAYVVECKRMLR
jgi:cytochrome c-type biogenesis protein CcmH/NrfG